MVKKVTALKARQQLGKMLEEVFYRGDQYIIERAGKPMAAVVPVAQLEEWHKRRDRLFEMIDVMRDANKDADSDDIEGDIQEAVQAVRSTSSDHQA